MKAIFIVFVVSVMIGFLLTGCTPQENETEVQVPLLENTSIPNEEEKPNLTPNTTQVKDTSLSWCIPSSETYGTMTFETIGLQENYLIEGKPYTVCEEKIIDSGKLNSHKWRTEDNKVIKEYRLDTDDKYGLTTDWINDAGQKCVRIEKEGVEPFLQCR